MATQAQYPTDEEMNAQVDQALKLLVDTTISDEERDRKLNELHPDAVSEALDDGLLLGMSTKPGLEPTTPGAPA